MSQSHEKKWVILVCNDSVLVDCLRVAIESTNEFYLFQVFQDSDTLIVNLPKYPSTLIIFSISASELSLSFKQTRRRISNPMLVIGNTINQDEILSLIQYGVLGYVERVDVAKKLLRAIREISIGRCFFDGEIVSFVISAIQLRPSSELTSKEYELLEELATGKTYMEICLALHIGRGSLSVHIQNLYRKLGANKRSEVLERAREKRLISFTRVNRQLAKSAQPII